MIKTLKKSAAERVVYSLIFSRLDMSNSLLYRYSSLDIEKLQQVRNGVWCNELHWFYVPLSDTSHEIKTNHDIFHVLCCE